MKAIHLKAYGNPIENLEVVEVPDIVNVGDDQVIIDVYYSPVNSSDLLLAKGVYAIRPDLPAVIGGEGVGKIAKIGRAVTMVKVGDIVTIPFGTFAWSEKVVADSDKLSVLPNDIDLQQASMVSINPPTAVLLLDKFPNLHPGDWIVLNAANSSVARAIIGVAKAKGLKTLGIVRRQEAVVVARASGADAVLVEQEDIVEKAHGITNNSGISVGFDAVGGKATNTLARLLGDDSNLVAYAFMSGEPMVLDQVEVIFKRISLQGFFMYSPAYLPKLRDVIQASIELISSGKISVPVTRIYKPEQIAEAVQHTIDGGKVLLEFNR
jgi:NADPH:quinone reductase-like Zn-dependent oxidoreductase